MDECVKMEYNEMKREEDWVIEAQDVSFTYDGNDAKALDGLSLKIRRGAKVAFMGGNGSGKSTFFLCLNGIRKPDRGKIWIDGSPISYTRKGLLDVRSKVGIVFQEPDNQLFSASVYEEVSFGILNLGADEETAKREVEHVLAELEITPFQDRPVHALSGGQKKQVAVADILFMHPEVMILDEPVAALDPKHTRKVQEIVEGLSKKGITVLMATHDIDYAYAWSDEIVLMKNGKVIRQGTPDEVCSDETVLKEAGLELPVVVRVYERMRQKGMISEDTTLPKSVEALIENL